MARFKTRKTFNIKNKVYIGLFILSFLCTFLLISKDELNKENLLSSMLSEITNEDNYFIKKLEHTLSSPKSILYASLNKASGVNVQSVFAPGYVDDFNYDEAKSDYIEDPMPEISIEEPLVYIYNTHQLEEYEGGESISSVKPNVMVASYIFREKLKDNGINALVETNNVKKYLNDHNLKYNMSYHATEYFARTAQNAHPSIMYMFDIHRDSVNKSITYFEIDGKAYAKMMLLVGYEHTKRENNTGFAEKLNEILERDYPGLSRGVKYYLDEPVNGVYNSNLNGKGILIEVGGVDSKIEEVNNSMEALADAFSKYLKED